MISFAKECLERLHAGETIDMDEFRRHYTTAACRRAKASLIRRSYSGPLDEEGCVVATALERAAQTEEQAANVKDLVRFYGQIAWTPTGNEDLDRIAGDKHLLLPAHVRRVQITAEDAIEAERIARRNLTAKHKEAIQVDGSGLLRWAREHLSAPDTRAIYDLSIALLILTGRRTCEILNGKSTFAFHDATHHCVFHGQLKKRHASGGTNEEPYCIPLLASHEAIDAAMRSLRARQPADIAAWENLRVSKRYQSGLNAKAHNVLTPFIDGKFTIHSLRSIYAACVARLFKHRESGVAIASRVCGHNDVECALAYLAVNLSVDADEQMLGTLEPP